MPLLNTPVPSRPVPMKLAAKKNISGMVYAGGG